MDLKSVWVVNKIYLNSNFTAVTGNIGVPDADGVSELLWLENTPSIALIDGTTGFLKN